MVEGQIKKIYVAPTKPDGRVRLKPIKHPKIKPMESNEDSQNEDMEHDGKMLSCKRTKKDYVRQTLNISLKWFESGIEV